jgi:hypothetical protein
MVVRLFRCGWCGHRLRFGSRTCGSCHRPTPFYNRRAVIGIVAIAVAGSCLAVIAAIG